MTSWRSALAVAALLAATLAAVPAAARDLDGDELLAETVAPRLVIDGNFPDPEVVRFGTTYYAYATNTGGKNVPVATAASPDGPWTRAAADALPRLGGWAGTGKTWAPDVSQLPGGGYLLYYTAHSTATGRQCIGTARSDSPAGPFVPAAAPWVCNTAEAGDIDPSSFVDADGSRYMLYKDDRNAIGQAASIYLQRVSASDGVTKIGARTKLLSATQASERNVVEAPRLVRRASRYVLFYSGGPYGNGEYFTSYATSTALTGPYTKAFRPLITTASTDGAVVGPGGADVLADTGGNRIMFHGWRNSFGQRSVYAGQLGWAGDLPVVRGSRVRYEAENGTINHAEVRSTGTASQGRCVAKIDFADSWVQLRVYAPAAGAYSAYVRYSAGYGDATHALSVNGGAATVVTYPNTGWETWRQVRVDTTLNAGWNTIRLTHRTRWAELDFVEVA